jgi:hypothetical protein
MAIGMDIKPVETTLYVLLLVTRLCVGGQELGFNSLQGKEACLFSRLALGPIQPTI